MTAPFAASAGRGGRRTGEAMAPTTMQTSPRSRSRKVKGYIKTALALGAARRKREERYERFVHSLDRRRDELVLQVAVRLRALSGGQLAAVQGCEDILLMSE